jgi:hypothetical protein
MEPQLFTDGIGRITVIGGVVRLDMVTYSPNETDANGRPRQVFTQRIVMGTDAFLRSSEKIVEIVQQLTKAMTPQAKPAATPQPARPAAPPAAPVAQPAAQSSAPRGAPPYVTGPLFPPAPEAPQPPQPPKAPFP